MPRIVISSFWIAESFPPGLWKDCKSSKVEPTRKNFKYKSSFKLHIGYWSYRRFRWLQVHLLTHNYGSTFADMILLTKVAYKFAQLRSQLFSNPIYDYNGETDMARPDTRRTTLICKKTAIGDRITIEWLYHAPQCISCPSWIWSFLYLFDKMF